MAEADRAKRDNQREAVFRFSTPPFTALSSALFTSLSWLNALLRSLPSMARLAFLMRVLIMDLMF